MFFAVENTSRELLNGAGLIAARPVVNPESEGHDISIGSVAESTFASAFDSFKNCGGNAVSSVTLREAFPARVIAQAPNN